MNKDLRNALLVIGLGLLLWFIPIPQGLTPQAWHLFALTAAIILGFILSPLPIGAVAFIGITIVALTGTLKLNEVLSGFGNSTMWLIVSAFIFSRAFIKTGLGRRIAYHFLRLLGDSTLKVGYALVLSDLVLAPLTPSSGARAGAIMYPIVRSLSTALGSEPGDTSRRAGAYLIQVVYQCEGILCAMFMTAMAGNALVVDLAAKTANIQISWPMWLLASCVPAVLCLITYPWILYRVYPPELKHTPQAKALASEELAKMGPMSFAEKVLTGTFLVALLLWVSAGLHSIGATVVAMAAVCVLLVAKVIEWKDMLNETGAWDTLIWMGSLVALAGQLAKKGFIPWFAQNMSTQLGSFTGITALVLLLLVYMYSHYGFASMTAHISAMYAAFLAVAVAAGAPPMVSALSLGFVANLCLALTHYSGTASPMFFGANFVDLKTWWKLGFFFCSLNMIIWLGVGSVWWKIIGLY